MKKKVLVVDDEKDIVDIVIAILIHNDFDAKGHFTSLGIEEIVKIYEPDLILLDIRLHGEKSGTEICKELKKESSVPVVLFSAELGIAWKDCNADDFIHKPFDMAHLVNIVNSHIKVSSK